MDDKTKDMMALIPLMGNAMSAQTPQLEWTTGLIGGIFHNMMKRKVAESTALDAEIARNNLARTQAIIGAVQVFMTAATNIQTAMKQQEHTRSMMELEEVEKREIIKQEIIKTKTMDIEFKTAELTYQKMLKEMSDDSTA